MQPKTFANSRLKTPGVFFSIGKRAALMLWLALTCFAPPVYSQGTLAPLYLYTSGDGSITPYQSGQMLEAGQTYEITAIPDAGYQFSSWQPVNIFIITQTNYAGGNPIIPPVQSIIPSVVPTNIFGADLEFALQSVLDVTADGLNPNIVEASGWQADFVPIPEPAEAVMVGCGFAVMAVIRRRTWKCS